MFRDSMVFLGCLLLLTAARAAGVLPAFEVPAEVHAGHSRRGDCPGGEKVTLVVVPETGGLPNPELNYDETKAELLVRYRMQFNQLTEGWNWHPLAAIAGDDYYRYKYLPLGGTDEVRGDYVAEDKIGSPQTMRVQWRIDYFFAFDNPYQFYAREADDDMGFVARIKVSPAHAQRLMQGDLGMALRGRLQNDCVASSVTFWKATSARPTDHTLKKRYLVGSLERVWFFDKSTAEVLAELAPNVR